MVWQLRWEFGSFKSDLSHFEGNLTLTRNPFYLIFWTDWKQAKASNHQQNNFLRMGLIFPNIVMHPII